MISLYARQALLPEGLTPSVRVRLAQGQVAGVETGVSPAPDDETVDALLPAMPNLHSHAFQRAMAGQAERRGDGEDSFWSWRTVMYRLALGVSPDHVQAIAAQLYMEMLESGFGRVGEFHYLHHDPGGRPYADPAEMAGRIAAASADAGIGLTLLPVFYAHSGFGGQAPLEMQRRFLHDQDGFARLIDRARTLLKGIEGSVLGVAPHSLRAVTPETLAMIVPLAQGGPVHIHIAEQRREVADCLAWCGQRPVEWLLDHAPVDDRWCLVHATHMTAQECTRLAHSGAVAGLCPITEANLGDGIFPLADFIDQGGVFGVGSDSNILIALTEELRLLEYGQRLTHQGRNIMAPPGGSTGLALYQHALKGGARALGAQAAIRVGAAADLVALDGADVPWCPPGRIVDQWVFAQGFRVDKVWVRGHLQVSAGRHLRRDGIHRRFQAAMTDVFARCD